MSGLAPAHSIRYTLNGFSCWKRSIQYGDKARLQTMGIDQAVESWTSNQPCPCQKSILLAWHGQGQHPKPSGTNGVHCSALTWSRTISLTELAANSAVTDDAWPLRLNPASSLEHGEVQQIVCLVSAAMRC